MEKKKKVCLRFRDSQLIMFLAEYGIITNENVKLLYKSEYYYKNRLASLAKGEMVERLYGKVVLGRKGKNYLSKIGIRYRNINRNENYKKRIEGISDIACKLKDSGWYFEPSWRCEVNTYTKRGNRFIGVTSREKRWYEEDDENYFKRSFIVYFIHKDITTKELKYIYREIERHSYKFYGLIVFSEIEIERYKSKLEKYRFSESYVIPFNKNIWKYLKLIKDENYMKNKTEEIFGDALFSLNEKSFFEEYYTKENDAYTYIYYMPFVNYYMLHYINFEATSNLFNGTKAKVVCLDTCIDYVRKYLDECVEVTCVSNEDII